MTTEENPILYLIMRNDLKSLNSGKLAAQAAHGTSILHEIAHKVENHSNPTLKEIARLFKVWCGSPRDFGTTIVLAGSYDQIKQFDKEHERISPHEPCLGKEIIDPTYPFFLDKETVNALNICSCDGPTDLEVVKVREEVTGFMFFADANNLPLRPDSVFFDLKLYP